MNEKNTSKTAESAEAQLRGRLPSKRRIISGGVGFVIFSVLGIVLAAVWYPSTGSQTFASFPLLQILLLVLLAGVDFFLGGLRYSIFFNGGTLPKISLWRCMCANWANMLMGVVTPFQTGGGPAQIYMMWREGARVSEAVLISLLTFLATLLFFLVASGVTIFFLSSGMLEPVILAAIRACFFVISAIAIFVLGLLVFPAKGVRLVRWLTSGLSKIAPSLEPRIARVLQKTEVELDVFRLALSGIVKRHPGTLPTMVMLTMSLFFNKYLIGYVVAKTLESTIPFDTFMGLQVIQHLIIYYAPTPGASGLAGISATWLLSDLLSPEKMITYIVIWRFFTTLLGALLGVGVIADAFRSPAKAMKRRNKVSVGSVPSEVA